MIAFVTHVYNDEGYAIRLFLQLRVFYPDNPIICIADGIDPIGFDAICSDMGVTYIKGDRLKLTGLGAAWTKRWMSAALDTADVVIRLDPDVMLWRRPKDIPMSDIFGMMLGSTIHKRHYVRGCCSGYQNKAIGNILTSGMLDDPLFKNNDLFAYRRYWHFRMDGEEKTPDMVYSEDPTIAYIAEKLGMSMENWSDIHVCFREPLPDNQNMQWSITHPHR